MSCNRVLFQNVCLCIYSQTFLGKIRPLRPQTSKCKPSEASLLNFGDFHLLITSFDCLSLIRPHAGLKLPSQVSLKCQICPLRPLFDKASIVCLSR